MKLTEILAVWEKATVFTDKNKIINKKSGNFILIKNLRTLNSSVNLFLVRFFFITLFFNYYYLAK